MSTADELQQRAIEYAKTGTFGAPALDANLELTRVAPANEGGWTRLARCYMEAGRLDDATAALDAVLRLNPQNTIALSLQVEVTKRRVGARAATTVSARPARPKAVRTKDGVRPSAAFGLPEFAALAELAPEAAMDVLGPRVEALLMAVNERPFAQKAVETRNRAGRTGARLYRRGSFQSPSPGHIDAFQRGGRWEPQLNLAVIAATNPGGGRRNCVRAGIGFNLTSEGGERSLEEGHARILAYFAHFQELLTAEWRSFLAGWLASKGACIQYGAERPPAVTLRPDDAIALLLDRPETGEVGWVFCGRWLFADAAEDAAILADARKLVSWIERTMEDLLPLWTSVYRIPARVVR